jgi:hypothetical protein
MKRAKAELQTELKAEVEAKGGASRCGVCGATWY